MAVNSQGVPDERVCIKGPASSLPTCGVSLSVVCFCGCGCVCFIVYNIGLIAATVSFHLRFPSSFGFQETLCSCMGMLTKFTLLGFLWDLLGFSWQEIALIILHCFE